MDDLRTVLQDSWSKAVLAATSVEEQAQALLARVGHLLEGAANPEVARQLMSDVQGRLEAQRQELHAHVQRAIQAALDKVRLPSRAEIDALHQRLTQLEARLASIEHDGRAGPGDRSGA